LTVIWRIGEFHVVDMMPLWRRFNTEYVLSHIKDPISIGCREIGLLFKAL
jgi:hypothetical protein